MNLWTIFLTGLTTGGLTCLAMQGGLLASVVANHKKKELSQDQKNKPINKKSKNVEIINRDTTKTFDFLDWLPVVLFLGAKLVSHTIAGFLLGWIGSVISIQVWLQLVFQALAGFFMFATAMNLLNVHPIFRWVSFQPPKSVQRLIHRHSKQPHLSTMFPALVLGFLTVLIPCGVTQSMQLLALSTGDPLWGAAIMASFVVGTMPVFGIVGVATARLSESLQATFTKTAAALLIVMALYGLNGVLVVINSPITLQKITQPITYFFSEDRFKKSVPLPEIVNGKQIITIQAVDYGYNPKQVFAKAGIPVELTIFSDGVYSCSLAFQIPAFDVSVWLDSTDKRTVSFTPTEPGRYTYTCSMGMYTGVLEVIE